MCVGVVGLVCPPVGRGRGGVARAVAYAVLSAQREVEGHCAFEQRRVVVIGGRRAARQGFGARDLIENRAGRAVKRELINGKRERAVRTRAADGFGVLRIALRELQMGVFCARFQKVESAEGGGERGRQREGDGGG